mmetsp:Transcript_30287/g.22496  ORF Transcript_30287/g.22496 Transcript_30287/m.22496 type:complete len:82 (+) Transcript_30287:152-397(+)
MKQEALSTNRETPATPQHAKRRYIDCKNCKLVRMFANDQQASFPIKILKNLIVVDILAFQFFLPLASFFVQSEQEIVVSDG